MNFLAHAYLAPAPGACRVGSMLADCLPGRVERLAVPAELADGIRLHRYIDSFIDRHPLADRSRGRLPAGRRRVSGVIVDMAYDHFLARYWHRFHTEPLPRFTARCYAEADQQAHWLPPRCHQLLEPMRRGDWLASYAEVDALSAALDGMARRLSRPALLRGAGTDVIRAYEGLERDFLAFMPEAIEAARDWRGPRT